MQAPLQEEAGQRLAGLPRPTSCRREPDNERVERLRNCELVLDASGYRSMIAISFKFSDARIDGCLDVMADR